VWLKEQFGRRAYFPDENKKFAFGNDAGHGIYILIVEGAPYQHQTGASVPVGVPMAAGPSSGQSTVLQQPLYKPVGGSGKNREPTLSLKVVQATMQQSPGGKPEFTRLSQAFIDITDSTANVPFITSVIRSKWGSEYVLVTADGLQIEDSSGTQGKRLLYT